MEKMYKKDIEKLDREHLPKMKDRRSKCDNCGYISIIDKIPTAICPNCMKNKLIIKGGK